MRTAAGLLLACGTFLLGVAPAVGAAPPAEPDVRVSPSTVQQGQRATAFGDGFCSSRRCSLVAVYLDSRRVGSAAVSRQGTFALTFRAVASAGGHRVTAVQSSPKGSSQASTSLVVRSAPTATRTTTPPATTTTKRPTTTTTSRPSTSRSTTTTTTPTSRSSLGSTSIAGIETSSTSPTVLPAGSPPEDLSSGYLGLLWWLVPAAVGALLVIGLVAWRQRPTGAHHEPGL